VFLLGVQTTYSLLQSYNNYNTGTPYATADVLDSLYAKLELDELVNILEGNPGSFRRGRSRIANYPEAGVRRERTRTFVRVLVIPLDVGATDRASHRRSQCESLTQGQFLWSL